MTGDRVPRRRRPGKGLASGGQDLLSGKFDYPEPWLFVVALFFFIFHGSLQEDMNLLSRRIGDARYRINTLNKRLPYHFQA